MIDKNANGVASFLIMNGIAGLFGFGLSFVIFYLKPKKLMGHL
jgi:hypothetical protein